jgi:hypothetical protein
MSTCPGKVDRRRQFGKLDGSGGFGDFADAGRNLLRERVNVNAVPYRPACGWETTGNGIAKGNNYAS